MSSSSLTTGQRLAMGFGLVLALMIGITAFGIQKVNLIDNTLTEITDVNAVKQRYAINFRGSVHDRAISLRDVTLVRDAAGLTAALQDIERLTAFYQDSAAALDKLFASDPEISQEERQLLAAIQTGEALSQPLMQRVIQARQDNDVAGAQALLLAEARPALSEWLTRINAFIDYQEKRNQAATAHAREVAGQFALFMVTLCSLAIVIGSVIAFQITRQLGRALGGEPNQAAQAVTRIASGDLSMPVRARTPGQHAGGGLPHAGRPAQPVHRYSPRPPSSSSTRLNKSQRPRTMPATPPPTRRMLLPPPPPASRR